VQVGQEVRCSLAADSLLICCFDNNEAEDFRDGRRQFAADSLAEAANAVRPTRISAAFVALQSAGSSKSNERQRSALSSLGLARGAE